MKISLFLFTKKNILLLIFNLSTIIKKLYIIYLSIIKKKII